MHDYIKQSNKLTWSLWLLKDPVNGHKMELHHPGMNSLFHLLFRKVPRSLWVTLSPHIPTPLCFCLTYCVESITDTLHIDQLCSPLREKTFSPYANYMVPQVPSVFISYFLCCSKCLLSCSFVNQWGSFKQPLHGYNDWLFLKKIPGLRKHLQVNRVEDTWPAFRFCRMFFFQKFKNTQIFSHTFNILE